MKDPKVQTPHRYMSLGNVRGGFLEGKQLTVLGAWIRVSNSECSPAPDIHFSVTLGKSLTFVRINDLISGKVL